MNPRTCELLKNVKMMDWEEKKWKSGGVTVTWVNVRDMVDDGNYGCEWDQWSGWSPAKNQHLFDVVEAGRGVLENYVPYDISGTIVSFLPDYENCIMDDRLLNGKTNVWGDRIPKPVYEGPVIERRATHGVNMGKQFWYAMKLGDMEITAGEMCEYLEQQFVSAGIRQDWMSLCYLIKGDEYMGRNALNFVNDTISNFDWLGQFATDPENGFAYCYLIYARMIMNCSHLIEPTRYYSYLLRMKNSMERMEFYRDERIRDLCMPVANDMGWKLKQINNVSGELIDPNPDWKVRL